MKEIKMSAKKFYCKSCKKQLEGGRSYLSNPFCNDSACLDVRREESNSFDLRNNQKTIEHENGYATINPIDPTKLWKASEENKKIVSERRKKYYEENND